MTKRKQPEPTRLEKIRMLANEIRAHQERMLELIAEEAAIDKAANPDLPLEVLKQLIMSRGVCPCSAMLARLDQKATAAELDEAARKANG